MKSEICEALLLFLQTKMFVLSRNFFMLEKLAFYRLNKPIDLSTSFDAKVNLRCWQTVE